VAQKRTQRVVTAGGNPTTTNYVADLLNVYTSVGGTTHRRDANGNLRDDGTYKYAYDYRNQLVEVRLKSDNSLVATYDSDVLGRRIAKSTSSGGRSFYWTGMQLAMEYDGSGLFSRRHYGATFGEVAAASQRDIADLDADGNTAEPLLLTPTYDGAFDCVGVLGPTGAVVESYVHTYEGQVTITNGSGQTISSSAIGWQQGYGRMSRDDETGLLYAVHRYYKPGVGRFTTEDPLGRWHEAPNVGSGYAWVANALRNFTDHLGLAPGRPRGNASAPEFHRTGSVVEVIRGGLAAAVADGSATPEMQAMNDALNADAEIEIVVQTEDERHGDDFNPNPMESDKFATPKYNGRTKYRIRVRAKALGDWDDFESALFNMLHELDHIAKWRCGDLKPHHPDEPARKHFDRGIAAMFEILRRQKLEFGRFVTQRGFNAAKRRKGIS
jgi:RHS repeat-associated protein